MIEFQHVFKSYGRGRNILADINFRVSAGEFVFVSGPSGAGKSTLLKLIGGLDVYKRQLISAEEAVRRVLILENPGLPGQASITQSLYAGLQLILPLSLIHI